MASRRLLALVAIAPLVPMACTKVIIEPVVVSSDAGNSSSASSSAKTADGGDAAVVSDAADGSPISVTAEGGDAAGSVDDGAPDAVVDGAVGMDGAAPGDGGTGASDGGDAGRCDDAGRCTCFDVASVGLGGQTGSASIANNESAQAFVDYLNGASNANAVQIGCAADAGCAFAGKPTLTAGFLAQHDVLVFQWMANSIADVFMNGTPYGFTGDTALGGGGYWSFSSAELSALKAWVMGGGGVIVLAGYDYCPGNPGCSSADASTGGGDLGPANQILQALTDIQYTSTSTFGMTETGNAEFCLGDSDPVTGWAPAPDILGENITAVGAFHGSGITPGANATVDCQDGATVCAVHEDVGKGHVYVYTDEWVTYVSQWNPPVPPATYCVTDGSTAAGDYPAVQSYYQVPQFWYNAIRYASQATGCPFTLQGATAN